MKKYRGKPPDEVMRLVTTEIVARAARLGRASKRPIYISKTSKGPGVEISTLDPRTPEGCEALDRFLTPVKRFYTISGLGHQDEDNAINWRKLNLPLGRRVLVSLQVLISLFLKGTPFKNRFLRWMGVHIGQGAEIMQMVWLDHFRPELIFIGENTLVGAFSRVTVHAYEGAGRFRFGFVEIGPNCTIGAGTGMGPIRIGEGARTLPGTALSPYLIRVRPGAVVGWNPPDVRQPDEGPEPE